MVSFVRESPCEPPFLPEEDVVGERPRLVDDGLSEKDDLLLPDGFVHGKESDVAFWDLGCNPAHVTDNAVNLVILSFKEIEAVLDPVPAEGFKFFSQQGLLLGFRNVIGKHHEHGGRKVCRWRCR